MINLHCIETLLYFKIMSFSSYIAHFALNSKNDLVHINNAIKSEPYHCPYCKNKVIARQGNIREWHFAHQPLSNCSNESYLHELAKIKISQWIKKSTELILHLPTDAICENNDSCKWYDNKVCNIRNFEYSTFNLKEYYNDVSIETQYQGFVADILLANNNIHPPIFIEICVTHPCDQKKINSGIRIIEFIIENEDDINRIVNNSVIDNRQSHIRIYNFLPKPIKVKPTETMHMRLKQFKIFKSGKMIVNTLSCKNKAIQRQKSCLLEITIPDIIQDDEFYSIGSVIAIQNGLNIRICELCKYSNAIHSKRICSLYKKFGTPKYHNNNPAVECRYYRTNDKLITNFCDEICNHHMPMDVWLLEGDAACESAGAEDVNAARRKMQAVSSRRD